MKVKGFTLIELIVVIAIIAVLAAIIAPNAFKAIEKAKISATIADLQSIKTAAMSYYSDTGAWVATCATSPCSSGFVTTNSVAGWDGPYLEKWPPQSKWAGAYTWTNASGSVFCTGAGCVAANERYSSISNVPQTAAQKIDQQLDGGTVSGTAGSVRYTTANPTTVNVLVSRDGATD